MDSWTIVDNTSKVGGYLRLECNGQRVCDFFPFARDADPNWVRTQAELIRRTMNGEEFRPIADAAEQERNHAP